MTMVSPDDGRPSVSRTARYKKVTKPLLERKRRARINRCLDELKDLMVGAFEVEGDNISKLEKADILELTVRHLTKLHSPQDAAADAERFQAGFGQCATEACQFILSMPGIDSQIGRNLVRHLSAQVLAEPAAPPASRRLLSPSVSPSASIRSGPSSSELSRNAPASPPGVSPWAPSEFAPVLRRPREEPPPVPVDRSLVCDISAPNPPYPRELAHPSPGLLMTVGGGARPLVSHARSPESLKNDAQIHDQKFIQSYEAKHVIMKKIREQILERQVRDSEIRDVPPSGPVEMSVHSSPSLRNAKISDESAMRMPFPHRVDRVSSTSVDPRIRSKGETKHYQPPSEDAELTYRSREAVDRQIISRERSLPVIGYNQNYHQTEQADVNNTKKCIAENSQQIKLESSGDESDQQRSSRKRRADYRSIHPKKRMIRNPQDDQNIDNSEDVQISQQIKPAGTGDTPRSALRDHRPTSAPHAAEGLQYQSRPSPKDYRVQKNHRSLPPHPSQGEQGGPRNYRLSPEALRRQYYLAEMRGQPILHQPVNNEQDDMWRPW